MKKVTGASVPDQALVSDQAAERLDPPGFDPSRESSSETVAIALTTWAVLSVIQGVFGLRASMWFGAGALVAAIVFLWEAGKNAQRRRDSDRSRNGGDGEAGSVRSTTARAEGIAERSSS